MHHQQCDAPAEFDHEIPIGDRVQGIAGDPVEPKRDCGHVPVHGKTGARKRSDAQRRDIDPSTAVGQTLPVTFQHSVPGEQVVPAGHGLGGLHMSHPRHDRLGFAFCQFDQGSLQCGKVCL